MPDSVLPRPPNGNAPQSNLVFHLVEQPFSFAITRGSNGEVLFNTSGSPLIFESQYLRLRTSLPSEPHLYGLGEHTDPFMLNTTNYTRTYVLRQNGTASKLDVKLNLAVCGVEMLTQFHPVSRTNYWSIAHDC